MINVTKAALRDVVGGTVFMLLSHQTNRPGGRGIWGDRRLRQRFLLNGIGKTDVLRMT